MTTTCPVCDNEVVVKLGEIVPHLRWTDTTWTMDRSAKLMNSGYVNCYGSGRIISLVTK